MVKLNIGQLPKDFILNLKPNQTVIILFRSVAHRCQETHGDLKSGGIKTDTYTEK